MWEPTAQEILLASAVLYDRPEVSDALFFHGAPARDNWFDGKLLDLASERYYAGPLHEHTIVLNGLTAEECQRRRLSYVGYETWKKKLVERGVREKDIIILPPSLHTGAESRNLLLMAKERGWERLIISSYPYHQLRCFLQIIALMPEVGYFPNVYNLTFHEIGWDCHLVKTVMDGQTVLGGKDVGGTLPQHIQEEYARIVSYAQEAPIVDGKPKYTRHATIPEMLKYLEKRQ